MTLHAIVAALGGDLYQRGQRANVPAPGHSGKDRSISLLLSEGRVVIHGFGGVDWRSMRDDLRRRGFIDVAGRLTGGGQGGSSFPRPDPRVRLETAARLWEGGVPVGEATPAGRHLRLRRVRCGAAAVDLRSHPNAPTSVYRSGGRERPAIVAAIRDLDGRLTAVELTYLHPNGRPALDLRLPRKTVGLVSPGASVRLAAAASEMLVGEGVITTLSAIDRFQLPGWALMSANNLAGWTPPPEVRRLLIAADRGAVGQGAALRLERRLAAMRIEVRILSPAPPFGDWNDVALANRQREEGGR